MRDYEKLVKGLRYCFEHDDCGSRCPYFSTTTVCADERAKEAADAIEELLAAFCLLCGICTSPPSAETFNSCEIVRGCLPELSKEDAE